MDESLQPTKLYNKVQWLLIYIQYTVIVFIARLFDVSRLSVHGMVPGPSHTCGKFGEVVSRSSCPVAM